MALKGSKSFERQVEAHPRLQMLVDEVAKHEDFGISCALRTEEEQERLLEIGKSWTKNSKHFMQADGYSHAIDVFPWVFKDGIIDWTNELAFIQLIGSFKIAAKKFDVTIKCGIDFKKNHDAPHIELVM